MGSTRPDINRSDKARHDNYKEHHAEPRNNRSDRTYKDSRGNEDRPRDRLKKFELTVSPNQLVAQLKKINDVRWPKPMTTDPRKRDNTRWFAFHREHGHATEDCCVLKREVEELLRRGYLRTIVANPNKWGPERPRSRSLGKSPP